MKVDMGGSAAVFGAAKALGQIKPAGVEVDMFLLSHVFIMCSNCKASRMDWKKANTVITPSLSGNFRWIQNKVNNCYVFAGSLHCCSL